MKKILATLLVAAMLLSLVIVAAVPAAAADGDWTTYATASEYVEGAEKSSVPGYKYTEDGVSMIGADYTGQIPFGTIQTKNKYNLQDGLYLEVRVDDFTYDADDLWININLWSQQMIEPGSASPAYGHGVQTLLRPKYTPETDEADAQFNLTLGNQSSVYHIEEFSGSAYTDAEKAEKKEVVVDLLKEGETIKYDVRYASGKYTVSINGVPAPEQVNEYLAKTFPDGQVYVGVTLRHSTTGGEIGCTITKFGKNADTAAVPAGDDSKDPVNNIPVIADFADPSKVEAGKPAIFLTGDLANSDSKALPITVQGATLAVNPEDFTIRMSALGSKSSIDCGLAVKSSVSYKIEDFPYVMVLLKNFCTCDDPTDCYAMETVNMYLMCGDVLAANDKVRIRELDMCWEPLVVEEDTTVNGVELEAGNYLYFFTNCLEASFEPTGRINGCNINMGGLKVAEDNRNYADMLFTAFFRSEEEAVNYVYDYLGLENPEGGDETETETDEATTEADGDTADEVTTEADGATTEADDATTEADDATTAAKGEEKTEAKTDDQTEEEDLSGCGSVVGTSVAAIIAVVAACGFVSFKKKED